MEKLYVPLMASNVTEDTQTTYLRYLHRIKADAVMLSCHADTFGYGACDDYIAGENL